MERNDRTKGNNLTRGGQITFHNIRMWVQVQMTMFKWVALPVLFVTALVGWLMAPNNTFTALFYYTKYQALDRMGVDPNRV
ncbi:type IV conjugative transfer system coupling protein TraD, partial [Vibrio sp. 10N.261.48.A2]